MDFFQTQLSTLCRTNPTSTKWIIVPSLGLGYTLGERLALQGVSWTNLRFTTPDDLAHQMAVPFLMARGIALSPDGVGPALMMRLLMELPSQVPAYFRHLADQPKMAEAVWGTVTELRLAGLTSTDLAQAALPNTKKQAELAALLQAYEEHLEGKKLADRAAMFLEAQRHPESCPIGAHEHWLELPDVIWAPLPRQLLNGLPGQRLQPENLETPGLVMPRRAEALSPVCSRMSSVPTSDSERLRFLLKPAAAPPPLQDSTLAIFRAGNKEGEVEEVFRRLLAAGIPLDQVEMGCASHAYVSLLWEKALRHDWPVTISCGISLVRTRPARALLAFGAWIDRGFPAGQLRRLLQSGDVHLGVEHGPTEGQAARLLARSEATWGRQTYAPAFRALASTLRERAADIEHDDETRARAETKAGHVDRLAEWIGQLLALVSKEMEQGQAPFGLWLDAAASYLETVAVSRNDLDRAATSALTQALGELRVLADLPRSKHEAIGLIASCIDRLTIGSDRARPGHLHVTTLAQVGYTGRPYTCVLGLEEGSVFPSLLEDPVLLDHERQGLSPTLPTSHDRVSEGLHTILSRLAALSGQVWMSFACRDTRDDREAFPSWLLLQAIRVLKPDREWTYEGLGRELGNPLSIVPVQPPLALTDAGWWLASLRGHGVTARPAVLRAFPDLAEGEKAERARESDQFTHYDGWVPAAGALLDPRLSGRLMSPTSLEKLAACPFRYFLQQGLGIEPSEDVAPDPDAWLDPMTRGSLLHQLYAQALRELRHRRELIVPAQHGPWLRRLGEDALARHRALVPPPSEQVFAREAEEFLNDLRLFLQLEAADLAHTAVGFEVGFGVTEDEGEPLASREPITIQMGDGRTVRLRGRIDRIDQLADHTYAVVDYKTGSARLPGGVGATFAGGRQLQHALYALAATQLLRAQDAGARVSQSAYYFPTVRGRSERVTRPFSSDHDVLAVLRTLLDVLEAGTFVHSPNADECTYCEFTRACGAHPVDRAQLKIENAGNAALAFYRRLAAYE